MKANAMYPRGVAIEPVPSLANSFWRFFEIPADEMLLETTPMMYRERADAEHPHAHTEALAAQRLRDRRGQQAQSWLRAVAGAEHGAAEIATRRDPRSRPSSSSALAASGSSRTSGRAW